MYIDAGTINTSKIHKVENSFLLAQGSLSVYDNNGERHDIKAPHLGFTKPGTKRAVVAHENSILITHHANPDDCRDIATLEARYACDTFEEFDAFMRGAKL